MTWTFGVSKDRHGAFWSINGKRFDPGRVDHRVRLGTAERWKLRNTSDTTHYVHLHEELWRTLAARRQAAAAVGARATRTPGGSTPARAWSWPRGSPTTPGTS